MFIQFHWIDGDMIIQQIGQQISEIGDVFCDCGERCIKGCGDGVGDGLSYGGELGACWGDGWEDWGREGVYCAFDVGAAYFCAERGGDGVDAAFCFYEF
jgi:hypothetical protein